MAGPDWADDDPADLPKIAANCASLLAGLRSVAHQRRVPGIRTVRDWHRRVYAGCRHPSGCYAGHFRGDPAHADVVGYEVGVGQTLADGLPEKVGVWSADVRAEVGRFLDGLAGALDVLDSALPIGRRPTTADDLHEVIQLVAEVHGEWVRIHPFANGNGRTARLWAAFLSMRYGLPVFVRLRPLPDDVAYLRAAKRSMGRPPDFTGDHREATAVFAHLLSASLLP